MYVDRFTDEAANYHHILRNEFPHQIREPPVAAYYLIKT